MAVHEATVPLRRVPHLRRPSPMTETWTSIIASAPLQDERDAIVALLIGAGAAGVQEHEERLVTYVGSDTDAAALADRIRAEVPAASLSWEHVGEIPVDTRWTASVGIQRVGALTVAPPWRAHECIDEPGLIVIEPATAFGTGEHPSTRLVLRCMQHVIRDGDQVADLGAGSAVLSIAAVRLGARSVAAIELDPGSIRNAEENIARNGAVGRVHVLEGDATVLLPLVAPVRVVLANILSSVILRLAGVMQAALTPDGRAVLGGVLVSERDELLQALADRGWRLVAEEREGEWWSGVIAPR